MTPDELRALDVRVAEARGFDVPAHTAKSYEAWARQVPRYSTDPAASRVLLDEMAAAGDVDIAHEVGLPWGVHMRAADEVWFDEAPTLDAATCRAWLAWKEAQG